MIFHKVMPAAGKIAQESFDTNKADLHKLNSVWGSALLPRSQNLPAADRGHDQIAACLLASDFRIATAVLPVAGLTARGQRVMFLCRRI
jgi:hypothetical protein